jgi:hypothetical protein
VKLEGFRNSQIMVRQTAHDSSHNRVNCEHLYEAL